MDKTRIVDARGRFDSLGVHFRKQASRREASKWFCYCWPSRRSMQRVRDKVKVAIGRENRVSLQQTLDRVNPILRGWSAYFGWLNSAQHFRKVDKTSHGDCDAGCRPSISADGARSGERHWRTGERPACIRRRAGCAYGLNAVGKRLPESRMRENLTYSSMRGCWRQSYGAD